GRDAVFADQNSLQADFVRHEPGVAPDGTTVEEPFVTLDWTFTLASQADGQYKEPDQRRSKVRTSRSR
ncbi:MAG: hypothetical protein WCF69_16390, partial [Mycobacterium sp.]